MRYDKLLDDVALPAVLDLDGFLVRSETSTSPRATGGIGAVARPLMRSSSRTEEEHGSPTGKLRYDLRAAICHQGETPQSGHYVTWARKDSGGWRLFNDSRVSDHNSEKIKEFGASA